MSFLFVLMVNETAIVVQRTACPVCATPPTVLYGFFKQNLQVLFIWSQNKHIVCVSVCVYQNSDSNLVLFLVSLYDFSLFLTWFLLFN